MKIEAIPLLKDNYAWLLQAEGASECGVVDPSEAGPVLELIEERGLDLTTILATHHHWDHVNGIVGLLEAFPGAEVVCSHFDYEAGRVPGATRFVKDGERFTLMGLEVECLMVPGHTLGAVAYFMPEAGAVFTGDTLFTAGCGRLFEGTPEQMYHSLARLGDLPGDTAVCCGHEYTENNLRFAVSIGEENPRVAARLGEVSALRAAGKPTVPASMELERVTNPFMRADEAGLRGVMGATSSVEAFAELRRRKDGF